MARLLKRGAVVGVSSLSTTTDWRGGWRVWADANGNSAFDNGELLREFPVLPTGLTLTASVSKVLFGAGGVQHPSGSTEVNFTYGMTGLDCKYGRLVTVNPMGRVSLARACAS